MIKRNGFIPSKANPITPGATAETVALYRRLIDLGKTTRFAFGTNDMLLGMPDVYPEPNYYETAAGYEAVGGVKPGFMGFEYHDSEWANRYGVTAANTLRARIVAAHAAGMMISLHNHAGNPVTGFLSRNTQVTPAPSNQAGTGYYSDKTGSPVTACLASGSKRTEWLAYLDRLAAFLASLVDSGGKKIPVMLRLLHECNGLFFWWSAEGASKWIDLWRDAVDYLRAQGVTNVLFAPNFNSGGELVSAWFPGDAYTDVMTFDFYNDVSNPAFSPGTELNYWFTQCVTAAPGKPVGLSEFGSTSNQQTPTWYTQVRDTMTTRLRGCSFAAMWTPPWGISTSDAAATKTAFAELVNDPRTIRH